MSFEELPHTADWAMRVRAASLPELFTESARGMNVLSGAQASLGPRLERSFTTTAPDPESLLVGFLSELIFASEQEHLVFDTFDMHLEPPELQVKMSGTPLHSIYKSIKAITIDLIPYFRCRAG